MPHFITDTCVGCTICAIKCPTGAITGIKKDIHVIDPDLCIDCSVCGHYCPYDSIVNDGGDLVKRVKAKDIHKAQVNIEDCTGCTWCVDICPFDAIVMVEDPHPENYNPGIVAAVIDKSCVGCKLCEEACGWYAIQVKRYEWEPSIQQERTQDHRILSVSAEGGDKYGGAIDWAGADEGEPYQ